MGPDAVVVQVLGQRPDGVVTRRVELENFADDRAGLRAFNDLAVHAHVPLRHDAQQVPVALQEAEVVTNSPGDPLALLLRHDGLDLPRQLVHVADEPVALEHEASPRFHVGHEAEECDVVAMEAVLIVERQGTDLARRGRAQSLHQPQ
jgi:hypothetical protein